MNLKLLVRCLAILCVPSGVLTHGKCPPLTEYMYSFDYALDGHEIVTYRNIKEDWCLARCAVIDGNRCRSVNYLPGQASICEVNSATRNNYPNSYNPRPGWIYYENKVADTLPPIVDGGWGKWGEWVGCISKKAEGHKERTRSRVCNNPAPQNDGKYCIGKPVEAQECVDSQWSSWRSWNRWSKCGVTRRCRQKSRDCTKNGGRDCDGKNITVEEEDYCLKLPGCFILLQYLPTSKAQTVTSFEINNELFVAFTNRGSWENNYETNSPIYHFREGNFTLIQTLSSTSGVSSVEHFRIKRRDFLALPSIHNGKNSKLDSIVYRWEAGEFKEFQRITTADVKVDIHFFTINNRKFLMVISNNEEVSIFEWKYGTFSFKVQNISIVFPMTCTTFNIHNDTLMVCLRYNPDNATTLFKWSGNGFKKLQILPSKGHLDVRPHIFKANGTVYLPTNAEYASSGVKVYRWDGADFVCYQALLKPGEYSLDSFVTPEGETFLVAAKASGLAVYKLVNSQLIFYQWLSTKLFNDIRAFKGLGAHFWDSFSTPKGETFLVVAGVSGLVVYKLVINQFTLHQWLKTKTFNAIRAFKHDGQQYIAVVLNDSESAVYIWTQAPQ